MQDLFSWYSFLSCRNILLPALVIALVGPTPALAAERVLFFRSDIQIARSGELTVSETIRAQVEGQEIKRGIFRDFPTRYTKGNGTVVEVGFHVQSVTR